MQRKKSIKYAANRFKPVLRLKVEFSKIIMIYQNLGLTTVELFFIEPQNRLLMIDLQACPYLALYGDMSSMEN